MYWLRTFGGAALEEKGQPLDRIGAHRKALALLVILAAERQTSRDRLASLLWPESDTEHARASLKQALHFIRRELNASDVIEGTGELRINSALLQSDVASFLQALDEGDLHAAINLYTGTFLDGVHFSDSSGFEPWLERMRADLLTRYRSAVIKVARAAESSGDAAGAVTYWQRLAGSDPLNAGYTIGLMRALEAAGERAGALSHARVHEALLQEQLGLPPDAAVVELADRLRASPVEQIRVRAARIPDTDQKDAFLPRPSNVPPVLSKPAAAVLVGILLVAITVFAVVSLRPPQREAAALPVVANNAVRGSIAVLPFLDLSDAADQEYFSDGLTEELIGALSRNPSLRVVARTSAFKFKGKEIDVRDVGKQLDVATVLEGSVRTTKDRLRISVQLIDARTGYHIWSETYERTLNDVFAVQQEISRAIVNALRVQLSGAGASMPPLTRNVEAYEAYLKGRFFARQRTEASLARASGYFKRAVALDPAMARAYAGLADVDIAPRAGTPGPRFTRARDAALHALALDSMEAEAHSSMGWIALWLDRDYPKAERHLRRALEINPGYAWGHAWLAGYLAAVGRMEESLASIQHARELDPLSPAFNTHVGSHLFWMKRYDEAAGYFRRAVELDSTFFMGHWGLGRVHAQQGRYDDAIRELQFTGTDYIGFGREGLLGNALARAGRRADALRLVQQLEARVSRGEYVPAVDVAAVYTGLGDYAKAINALERLLQERGVRMFFAVDPLFDPLHSSPRYNRLARELGLPSS